MGVPLVIDTEALTAVCRAHGVSRLRLFGSALTDAFDIEASDVDILVEFSPIAGDSLDAYFGLKEDLEALFSRPVDLIMESALKNPYFAHSAIASARELYAA